MDPVQYNHIRLEDAKNPLKRFFLRHKTQMLHEEHAFCFIKDGSFQSDVSLHPKEYQEYVWWTNRWMPKLTEEQYETFVRRMAEIFEEVRSDVSTMCVDFLREAKLPEQSDVEHRFIRAELPCDLVKGTKIEYDTLTTEFTFEKTNGESSWRACANHNYSNE